MTSALFAKLLPEVEADEVRVLKEMADLQSELRNVRKMLRALRGGPSRKPAKDAVTPAEAVAAVAAILTERGQCHLEVVKEEVEKALVASGKSRRGLDRRLREALSDARFAVQDNCYFLAPRPRPTTDAKGNGEV
jgi:hypothetical protein